MQVFNSGIFFFELLISLNNIFIKKHFQNNFLGLEYFVSCSEIYAITKTFLGHRLPLLHQK